MKSMLLSLFIISFFLLMYNYCSGEIKFIDSGEIINALAGNVNINTAKGSTDVFINTKRNSEDFDYLGQTPPGNIPVVFARGIISTELQNHGAPAFSPDGNEVFWQVNKLLSENNWLISTMTMRRIGNSWTEPELTQFGSGPFFSPDGKRLYFDSEEVGKDPYYIEKQNNNWSERKYISIISRFPEIKFAYNLSITSNGTLYFLGNASGQGLWNNYGIYRSELLNGEYTKPELLPSIINTREDIFNWTPFIAPDESYLIYCSRRVKPTDDYGDLYICFRKPGGSWTERINLGRSINTNTTERFPSVSPDGKYLFFTRWTSDNDEDVFWVSASIIDSLKNSIPYNSIDYLGQTPAGDSAVVFAPGIISVQGRYEYGLAVSPDGNEIFFTAEDPGEGLMVIRNRNGVWGNPELANLRNNNSWEFEAFFTTDGNKLFFTSNTNNASKFWYTEKKAGVWDEAKYLDSPINNTPVMWCTFSSDETIYYGSNSDWHIYKAKLKDGKYSEIENTGINGLHPSISPDESFFLFNSNQHGGFGKNDIFVTFRKTDGSWGTPVNLGDKINTGYGETCPSLSPDGKYIFFSRYNEPDEKSNIFWVSSSIIDSLKNSILYNSTDYFGQTPPGDSAVVFAPGIISLNNRLESQIAFSPHGNELYFQAYTSDYKSKIYFTKRVNNTWTEQVEAPFSINHNAGAPFFSADGNRLYFHINDGTDYDIYKVERSPEGWGELQRLPEPINSTSFEISYSETIDNKIYIDSRRSIGRGIDIWGIQSLSDQTLQAENLSVINSADFDFSPCIAPDGSYLIFGSERNGRQGLAHLYISFHKGNGEWTLPVDMNYSGAKVNSNSAHQSGPSLSPDGKFLFFMRHYDETIMDIYWISTEVIDSIKKNILTNVNDSKKGKQIVNEFILNQNYPNPFNPSTTISYYLPNHSNVKLKIYNLLGQELRTLIDSFQNTGEYSITWNGNDCYDNQVGSGVYIYKLETEKGVLQKKMVLVK